MVLFSKIHPGARGLSCEELLHPFTSSCAVAAVDMALACAYGSARFMAIIYLLSLLLTMSRGKRAVKTFLTLETLKSYLRSVSYGITTGTTFLMTNCFCRALFGQFNEFNCCFFPSFVGGLAVALETPSRRNIVITSYANMALETLLRRLNETGALVLSKTTLTLTFMSLNAALLYLRRFGNENEHSVWFFTPSDTQKTNWEKKLKKEFISYFLAGIAVSAARLVFSDLTLLINPVTFISKLITARNMALGAFLGAYVTSFQIADHFLTQFPPRERTVLAGLLSGMTIWLQPSRTILCSAAINVFQILLEIYQKSGTIPRFPYQIFLFCLYNGFLYHMRAMNPSAVPRTFIRIMSLATHKRSDYIYQYYSKLFKTAV